MPMRAHPLSALLFCALLSFVLPCAALDNPLRHLFGGDAAGKVAVKVAEIRNSTNVNGLDFSPDGKFLATSSYTASNEVHVWDWEAKKLVQTLYEEHGMADPTVTEGLRYSPDGRFLAACHGRAEKYMVVRIWDAKTGDIVHDIDEPEGGSCSAISFSPDSQILYRLRNFVGNVGDNIIAYEAKTWHKAWSLRTIPLYPVTLAISPDGKLGAFGGVVAGPGIPNQPTILIVDLLKHAIVRTIDTFPINNETRRVAWSPDGAHFAAGATVDGSFKGPDIVKIFDANTGNQIDSESVEAGHPARIRALRYSPDGKYLVEGTVNDSIRIWDSQHKTLLQEIPTEDYGMNLTFSRDGRFMAVTSGGREIQIWKMQ